MSAEIVPFGKYKGQPVEILAADTEYCEWLTAQPWFRSKYGNVYNILISGGAEPQDTPEHNEMQARFLDDDWCSALANCLWPEGLDDDDAPGLRRITRREFEQAGWDVMFTVSVPVDVYTPTGSLRGKRLMTIVNVQVECKPDLGDDYPTVLRAIQRRLGEQEPLGCCVIARRHAFEHVTWDQVRMIFAASKIRLLHESDLAPQPPQ